MVTRVKSEPKKKRLPYLSVLVRTFYALQSCRVLASNRVDGIARDGQVTADESKQLHEWLGDRLLAQEEDLHKLVKQELDAFPVWDKWFKHVKGIGPTIAGALIAEIRDPGRFADVSKLWAYAGFSPLYYLLHCQGKGDKQHKLISSSPKPTCPIWTDFERTKRCALPMDVHERVEGKAMRRKAGYRSTWNDKLKLATWKAATSFVKVGGKFKVLYYETKQKYQAHRPDRKPGRQHMAAMRKVGKIFLAMSYSAWAELDGISVPRPYVFDVGGHKDELKWKEMTDK